MRRSVKIIFNALWVCLCVYVAYYKISLYSTSFQTAKTTFLYIHCSYRKRERLCAVHTPENIRQKSTDPLAYVCIYLVTRTVSKIKAACRKLRHCLAVTVSPTALMGGRWKDLNYCPRATFTLLLTASCGKIYGTASFFLTPPIPTLGVFPCLGTLLLLSFPPTLGRS